MECRTCKFSKVDSVKDDRDNIVYPQLCCHRYAPRMIYGTGTGFKDWEYPHVDPDDFCGEYEPKEDRGWINIESRLPVPETSQGERFLVVRFGNMGKRYATIKRFCCEECWVDESVTHWMPLPELPKRSN